MESIVKAKPPQATAKRFTVFPFTDETEHSLNTRFLEHKSPSHFNQLRSLQPYSHLPAIILTQMK